MTPPPARPQPPPPERPAQPAGLSALQAELRGLAQIMAALEALSPAS